jgi:hypothetical protein
MTPRPNDRQPPPPPHPPPPFKKLPRLLHAGRLRRPRDRQRPRQERPQHPAQKPGGRHALRAAVVGRRLRVRLRAVRGRRHRGDGVFLRGRRARDARDFRGAAAACSCCCCCRCRCSSSGGYSGAGHWRRGAGGALGGAGVRHGVPRRRPPAPPMVLLLDVRRRLRDRRLRVFGGAHPARSLPGLHSGSQCVRTPLARALGVGRSKLAQRFRVALPRVGFRRGDGRAYGRRAVWPGGGGALWAEAGAVRRGGGQGEAWFWLFCFARPPRPPPRRRTSGAPPAPSFDSSPPPVSPKQKHPPLPNRTSPATTWPSSP